MIKAPFPFLGTFKTGVVEIKIGRADGTLL